MTSQTKNYRPPRRRPAHLRTKTGCLTCRKRKKKCDETPGTCSNCARRWLPCEWPVNAHGTQKYPTTACPSPNRGDQSGRAPQRLGNDWHVVHYDFTADCAAGSLGTGNEILRLTCASPSSHSDRTLTMHNSAPVILHSTPWTMHPSPAVTPASAPLFEFLKAVFLRQLVRPLAHDTVIESAFQESLALATRTPFYMHSLLACCGTEIPVDDIDTQEHFQKLARVHYVKAIAGLRESLDSGMSDVQNTAIIRTSLMLCIYERSKPRLSRGVDAHILGLAQLIQLKFRHDNSPSEFGSEADTAIARLMLEAFIFHATTSIPFQQTMEQPEPVEAALSIAESRLQKMFRWRVPIYPESPVLGAPPKLFVYAREIALMHERSSTEGVDIERCYELQDLLSQLGEDFKEPQPLSEDNVVHSTEDDRIFTSFRTPLLLGPRLYIVVSKILLRHMTNSLTPDSSLAELVCEGMYLVNQLDPLADYYAEYYGWPMVVLGTYTTDSTQRTCLLAKAVAFWKATRNGTMRRLVDMLTSLWQI
ncbi:Zn(II)2Cys6 transcription factor [Aspergillus alliaceus]|uniref:Zn(II)2Cys6 transcription factor n=1 Tax=Petromyces alliaceus TaxID=209559 RepID=UPI0012A44050|nr:uncharacterized protein BDW43DRAFT_285920 [Aspergillus alliaceus]KAB8230235.1 hypothetical protein BDW43DRAFT_285920 [Aspergillus alliaceus]